ncbi:ZYBA0S14-02718g1_1 [Zygosaccharomyces bailii CLIB 213]|uniref:ZYBA0S14-02718g1_1 n=1 Tax=Zygosaccharomyces bailii (strain CLIB 213 / ATCC 58445 / CBS 680 / BCRC 21525 / NBRC 1098 / NCYC 1416 / NRRL Y-2227) TaxID=1333698 RepID=A0A8J2TBH2_ZYGB2|nr:ZYBA0S14-02718g1_1 [Zygosaccharomyces bailii CLIB 213]
MESILDNLKLLPNHRRTTYKKVPEPNDETRVIAGSPPHILGKGFLFQNDTVNRVRERLMKNEMEEEKGTEESSDGIRISDLYEGAENLEDNEIIHEAARRKPVEQNTQIIPQTCQTGTRKEEIIGDIAKRKQKRRLEEKNLHSKIEHASQSTQKIDEDEETQLLPQTTNKDELRNDATLLNDYSCNALQITQLDVNESLLFQATMPDNARNSSGLKIHEVQKKLDEENQKKNLKANKEYKKPSEPINNKPTSSNKPIFSKKTFLEDFDEATSSEDETANIRNECYTKVQHEEPHKMLNKNSKKIEKQSLFSVYEHRLKLELDSRRCIALDNDEQSDGPVTLSSSRTSKATVLEIKTRRSRQEALDKTKRKRTTTNELISTLKRASKKQISNHQKELIERRGYKLEDIEKQKEEIENLLEQEIARNKRIAQREKEKTKNGICDNESCCSASESEDVHFSDDDLHEDTSDSFSDSEVEDTIGTEQEDFLNERSDNKKETKEDDKDKDQEEDESYIPKRRRDKGYKTPTVKDYSSDEEHAIPRNVINLGPYGNNLEMNTRKTSIDKDESFKPGQNVRTENELERELLIGKIRRSEEKQKIREQKFKDLKAAGLSRLFEMEAEESDDEWHGIGGKDGEGSEEYDSDLEEMIDDFTKSNQNIDDIRQLLVKENKEMDERMVTKILFDIKNGGFRKRGRNALELDLSDNEDEDLRAYRLKRREIIRKSRLENKSNDKVLKNSKSKAFLESMLEDIDEPKNPFGEMGEGEEEKDDTTELHAQETDADHNSKKYTISQAFVQQSLSFLNNTGDLEEFEMDDTVENFNAEQDISSLKKNSSIHTFHPSRPHIAEEINDEDFMTLSHFKSPSLARSFTAGADPNSKFQSGEKTVTVSKAYRAVGGTRSSITYFGKIRKLVAPKRKPASFSAESYRISNPNIGKLLESQENSFET